MGNLNLWQLLKQTIAGISFKVFLWASDVSEEEYFKQIEMEKPHD